MALNIKDPEAERLAAEVAELTGESKTAAVRNALRERRDRLAVQNDEDAKKRGEDFVRFLREEIWPHVSPEVRGKPLTKAEKEELLGYGPGGV